MENRVTLPPISDIFSTKEKTVASLPSLPRLNPSFPLVPFYHQQYQSSGIIPSYAAVPGYRYTSTPPGLPNPVYLPRSMQDGMTDASLAVKRLRSGSDPLWTSLAASSPQLESAESPGASHGSRNSRSRTRNNLPKETTYILLKWLNEHLNHPYPNSFEKTQLMMATGLNQQQLSNWFINARRRKIKSLRQKKLAE